MLDNTFRSWPQTEAIKATIALDRAGPLDLSVEIEQRVDRLFALHLDNAPKGLWIDQVDGQGTIATDTVPASIFYHIVGAFEAYLAYHKAL